MRWVADSRAWLALVTCAVAAAAIGTGTATAAANPLHRTCGIPPEEGAYSYTTTVGIRCRPAEKIAFRAVKKFCAHRHGCRYGCAPHHGWSARDG